LLLNGSGGGFGGFLGFVLVFGVVWGGLLVGVRGARWGFGVGLD
jgi:hypothetical protein